MFQHLSPLQRQSLVKTLTSPQFFSAQDMLQGAGDEDTERALVHLAAAVTRAVADRQFATIGLKFDAGLAVVRGRALSSGIAAAADKAVAAARETVQQLRRDGLLLAMPLERGRSVEEADRVQTASILRQCLAERLTPSEAHAAAREPSVTMPASDLSPEGRQEVEVLLRHLSSEGLQTLRAPPPAVDPIAQAVEREITERPGRLAQELRQEFQASRSLDVRNRSDTAVGHHLGSDLGRLDSLWTALLTHCALCEQPVPADIRTTLDAIEGSLLSVPGFECSDTDSLRFDQLEMASRTLGSFVHPDRVTPLIANVSTSVRRKVGELEQRAQNYVQTVLAELSGGTAAGLLAACKQATAVARELRSARAAQSSSSPAGAAAPRPSDPLRTMFLGQLQSRSATELDRLLFSAHGPEIRALIQVLAGAADEAARQNLPELRADLAETHELLQSLRGSIRESAGASAEGLQSGPANVDELLPETRVALETLFSTVLGLQGQVQLTAGRCAGSFAKAIVELVERPFSDDEMSSILAPDGTLVPRQFYKDAERGNTMFFTEDGEPLIDRRDWSSLDGNQKLQRVADGYHRLLRFYQDNDTQTRAILALANQATTGGITSAMLKGHKDSPIAFNGLGSGVLGPIGTNFKDMTTAWFSTSADHVPQLRLTYEMQGGRFDPVVVDAVRGEAQQNIEETMILDLDRSRAKIGVVVEADAQSGHLRVVGDPLYDVHLVRSPIQRPFPLPKAEHLVDARFSSELCGALKGFAESDGQSAQTINGLQALYQAVKANTPGEAPRRFEDVRRLYQTHLRPGARYPVDVTEGASAAVSKDMTALEEQTRQVFDAALDEAMRRIRASYETPQWKSVLEGADATGFQRFAEALRQMGGEPATLADFVDRVMQFKVNEQRTVDDALALYVSVFGEPGSDAPRDAQPPALGDEVIRETRRRIETVRDIREHCFQSLEPLIRELGATAARLLPAFTQQLREDADRHSGSVNVSELS